MQKDDVLTDTTFIGDATERSRTTAEYFGRGIVLS